ncbi:uncharacterized protein BX664DRAFT_382780 [Halteromyces radiatus]|uniref:uncharacterized protein n=1 Tax=Halteromyces radiatus TaxID=101107 RepID=UPI00221F7451|nr:uncharacterized protein BX664DRAFT_382780 [Halteromyces radiatus]KAI8096319.1 hypothetical protein BX664DRAFT_382780 [Halteromyces radiatus]
MKKLAYLFYTLFVKLENGFVSFWVLMAFKITIKTVEQWELRTSLQSNLYFFASKRCTSQHCMNQMALLGYQGRHRQWNQDVMACLNMRKILLHHRQGHVIHNVLGASLCINPNCFSVKYDCASQGGVKMAAVSISLAGISAIYNGSPIKPFNPNLGKKAEYLLHQRYPLEDQQYGNMENL